MTAPDPRLGEIEGRAELARRHAMTFSSADVAYLLAELRKAQDALGRVEGLAAVNRAAEVRFKANYPNGAWKGAPKYMRAPYLHQARTMLRAAVAAATGGDNAQE